jgi:energy-coupling factor transport system permease protein
MRTPWFDGLHPLTKLTWAFSLAIGAYTLPLWPWGTALWVIAMLVPFASRHVSVIYRTLRAIFIPIGLSLFVIQGLLFPSESGTIWQIGDWSFNSGGILASITTLHHIMTMGTGLLCVVLTTPPSHLTQALASRGLPRSIEYILLMALQIIPDMRIRAQHILEAQQSRGLLIQSVISRITAIIPLVGPLVVGALVDVEERAMALELRAFTNPHPPTRLIELHDGRPQHVARSVLLIASMVCIGSFVWGIWV